MRLFRWYCRSERLEELEGDLEEFFYQRLNRGEKIWKARFFFWWNVFRCYKSYSKSNSKTQMTMFPLFKSYSKLALRHSWKNKWSVLVNVLGLGIALSMCIFIYTLYAYNIEFDSTYADTEDIYRLHSMTYENNTERRNEISPAPLDDKLRNEISGISSVSSYIVRTMTVKKDQDFFSERISVASPDFVKMFNVPLWYGSFSEFGSKPVVYLSKPAASKYFGSEVALGKELTIYVTTEKKIDLIVGGVFEAIQLNSSFELNMLMSEEDYFNTLEKDRNDWSAIQYVSHYIRSTPEQLKTVEEQINRYIPLQNEGHKDLKMTRFELVPFITPLIADHILWRNNINARLRPQVYIIFTVLIAMVFLIACFNLANTSMAMMAKRLKEIGIRKTLGSGSRQILIQFLFEMGIISFFALIVALAVSNFTSRTIMGMFGATFLISDVDLTRVTLFIILFLIFTTLVAGLLPALYAWKFQPIAIMRKAVKLKGVNWLNKTLTIAQYGFSIAVLSAGITFTRNSDFLNNLDLGYDNEGIIDLNLRNSDYYGPMKQKVDQIPGVITAGTRNHFAIAGRYSQTKSLEIDTSTYNISLYSVGSDYLDLMGITLSSGRNFINGSEADAENSILVSQEFARRYFDGNDVLNEVVKIDGKRKTIVGVVVNIVDDVYEDSELTPVVIALDDKEALPHLLVKATDANLEEVEAELKAIWGELIDQPYNGQLQKDLALGQAGRDTKNLQKIFMAMALLGGFLSVVGIFSLAKLNVAKRIKEISIRKVLGATLRELLLVINRSFSFVLIIALIAGSTLGYFISDAVLGMIYSKYINVSPFTSLLSGAFIVIVSIAMITSAVFVPANSNPVSGLRDE